MAVELMSYAVHYVSCYCIFSLLSSLFIVCFQVMTMWLTGLLAGLLAVMMCLQLTALAQGTSYVVILKYIL